MGFDDTGLGEAMAQSRIEGRAAEANTKADALAVMVIGLMDKVNELDARLANLEGRPRRPIG